MAKNSKNPYVGKRDTPPGIMPEDQLKRHKLEGFNTPSVDPGCRRTYRHNRKMKYLFQMVKTYRLLAHGCHEPRLAQPLRDAVHYLVEPISRGTISEGAPISRAKQFDNDNSLDAVQVPLKV